MMDNDLKIEKIMIKNSILLCTFNEGQNILKIQYFRIREIINDLEIIVVDDASTDNTLSIIQKLKPKLI